MDIIDSVRGRVKMLGGKIDDERLNYIAGKSVREAKDFCNAHDFPEEARFYLIEWAAASYLTETDGYSRQWEAMRRSAEKGLIGHRRMIW